MANRKDRRQRSTDWSFPESPLNLTCTFLLVGLCITELRGPVTTGCLGRWFVNALLHPLHDQVQQCYHRLVHLHSCRCTRLKVWDPGSNKNRRYFFKSQQEYILAHYIMTFFQVHPSVLDRFPLVSQT